MESPWQQGTPPPKIRVIRKNDIQIPTDIFMTLPKSPRDNPDSILPASKRDSPDIIPQVTRLQTLGPGTTGIHRRKSIAALFFL